MNSQKLNITLICFILVSFPAHAQFLGGSGDGFMQMTASSTTLNQQEFYCSGGNSDGYGMKNSLLTTPNNQVFYCSGGNEDGFSMAAFISPLNSQNFYCSGGEGDGFGIENSPFSNPNIQDFYCSGGKGDGFGFEISPVCSPNIQDFYCSGGNADGFSISSVFSTINLQDFYCSGGNGDGFFMLYSGVSAPNDASFYCSGGEGDGHDLKTIATSINTQDFYCSGGNGDGYDYELYNGSIFGTRLFCLGGDGDGFGQNISPELAFGVGIWTGLTSTDWNTSSNWTHATIPNFYTNVTIPATCPNYPLVTQTMGINYKFSTIKCQRLDISAGASLSHTDRFNIYGEMRIEGNYISTSNLEYVFRIYSGGLVTIPSSGTVTLGDQTSGTGISDLIIYGGGILNLFGGTLEIDDQLRVRSGGTFNMTDGELFVHKYGEGSVFSSSFTGNLVLESGALGGVSGGTLKICGKESVGDYHAFNILEPTFDFTGTSTISFQHGVSATHYNSGIYAVDGVTFQNLVIDKPGNTIFVTSNLEVEGSLNIKTNSTLEIKSGNQITIGP